MNGGGEESQVVVHIPAEYVEDFRAAVVDEIRWEANCIVEDVRKSTPDEGAILDALEQDAEETQARDALAKRDAAVRFADVRSDVGLMAHDVALFDQLEEAPAGGDVELRAEGLGAMESLPHVFEAMARKVVGPRLQEALEVGPMDLDWLPKIREPVERLTWAVDRAAEYHKQAAEARELAGGRS